MPQPSAYASQYCPQCGGALPAGPAESLVCGYCGTRLVRQAPEKPLIQGVRLVPFSYTDREGTGLECFRMLLPAGWQSQGGLQWQPGNPGRPAVLMIRFYNPAGAEALEFLPAQSFYWTSDPLSQMLKPPGSLYYGNEVRPPMDATSVLTQVVLPRFRNIPGLQAAQPERLPQLPDQMRSLSAAPNTQVQADGARIRVQYTLGSTPVEEEIFAVVEATYIGQPGPLGFSGMIFWVADYLFACRAAKGRLDGLTDLFQTIIHSFRINPQWYAQMLQISQWMMQNEIQHIHQIGQFSRQWSQMSSEISDQSMAAYTQRQQVMDRLSTQFSQYMRGVDEYQDPNLGGSVELPSGYQQAWSNPLGEYWLTDDPNFDPNRDASGTWTPLERKP